MSVYSMVFSQMCARSDAKRDAGLKAPEDVDGFFNLCYGKCGDIYNDFDVYFPRGTAGQLPTVVSIHGGGYVYGTKENYRCYGMYIAQLGFSFVNMNYHLAPGMRFPGQLEEINECMAYLVSHAEQLHIDPDKLFLVGDSAGAQMASQYAAMLTNPDYASLFPFRMAEGFTVRALGLNCGTYDIQEVRLEENRALRGLNRDYFGKVTPQTAVRMEVLAAITRAYPPTFVMTAEYDFLKDLARPMYELLRSRGVEAEYHCYGDSTKEYMGHVCHVNMNLAEAKQINREETDFFQKYIR